MNTCHLNTRPCTVSGEEKLKYTGKVIKLGEVDKREWVCSGNMNSKTRAELPVLPPPLAVTKTALALSMCPGKF